MKKIRHIAFQFGLLLLASYGLTSCDKYNYTEDLQKLGARVERLEELMEEANYEILTINQLIIAIEANGYVTKVVENADGTTSITFNTGKTVKLRDGHVGKDGTNGKDGTAAKLNISVAKDPVDGVWYWTINGTWLLDGDGNKMRAGATDGKDGKDGIDGKNGTDGRDGTSQYAVVPQLRINANTRNWEISTDSGRTWTDTGYSADGKDGVDGKNGEKGKDGKNGQDGLDDLFVAVSVSADGKSITFTLRDGRTFTVPIG